MTNISIDSKVETLEKIEWSKSYSVPHINGVKPYHPANKTYEKPRYRVVKPVLNEANTTTTTSSTTRQ